MEELNVLYTLNDKYLDFCFVSLLSLIKNSHIKNIRCHMITSGFQKEDYQRINVFLKFHQNIEIKCYPLEQFNIEQYHIPSWKDTQIANARLFFQEIMDTELQKIANLLYLDVDTLNVGNLNSLKEFNKGLYAVKDLGTLRNRKKALGVKDYFNSGVLWINVKDWVNQNCQTQLIHFIEKNERPLLCPDQDILNCTFEGKIKPLPVKYNVSDVCFVYKNLFRFLYFYSSGIPLQELDIEENDALILHFYGLNVKPWMEGKINPYQKNFSSLMKEVNPNFRLEKLTGMQEIFKQYPHLYYQLFLMNRYVPRKISNAIKRTLTKSRN